MILECTSCRARYMVPVEAFAAGGRKVRCARCKYEWVAEKPNNIDVFAAPLPEKTPEEKQLSASPISAMATPTPNLPAIIRNRKWLVWLKKALPWLKKWLKWVVLAAIILYPPIHYREPIVKRIPDLRGFYEFFGLYIPHSGKGLVFDQVKSELRYDSGTMKLFVDGVIHNTTEEIQFIPDIRARALGPDKAIIQSWWVGAPAATVAAQADVSFHTEINAPMERTIEDVYLEFYAEDEKSELSK